MRKSEEKFNNRKITRRKFIKGVVGTGLAMGTLCSISPYVLGQENENSIVFATADLPQGIDPHIDAAEIWQRRAPLIYENLVWPDFELKTKPQLAESWERVSNTEFVFALRKGVKFHNGSEMDAEDVKFSYDRMLNKGYAKGHVPPIEKIEALDKYSVKFTLKEPAATFPIGLGMRGNAVVPKEVVRGGADLRSQALGTGPFKLTKFKPGTEMILEKHADYWDEGLPHLEKIIFREIPDESSIIAGLRAGKVQMTEFADSFNYFLVKGEPNLTNITEPINQWKCLDLNRYPEDSPTTDRKVRQAVQLGLNRKEIVKIAVKGLGDRLGILPPSMGEWSLPVEELPMQERDVDQARSLLKEAGYKNGLELKIRNIVGFPALKKALQVIVPQLQDVGIKVKVETLDLGAWIKDWMDRKSPPSMNAWGGFIDPDSAFFNHFHTPPEGMDFRRWNNSKADNLLEEGRRTFDREKRIEIYNELQRLIAREAIMVPLWAPHAVYSMQKHVKDFRVHPTDFYYGLKYVELK